MSPPSVAIKQQRNGENAPARCAGVVPSSERWTLGDELTHRQNATMHAILCKTARRRRIPAHCEFATHAMNVVASLCPRTKVQSVTVTCWLSICTVGAAFTIAVFVVGSDRLLTTLGKI